LIYDYNLCQSSITRTDSIKDLGVFIDSKLRFHNHVDYIFSQCIKLLGLVRTLPFSFSSLDCLYMLYFILVRSKLEYASVVWNSMTTTDANELERIQQRFAALCYYLFLPHVHYSYTRVLEYSKLHALRKRRYHLDAQFLIQVYRGLKYCLSLLEAVGLRDPTRYLRDFSMFNFSPSIRTVLLLDAHQLLMLSAGTLMYLKQILFPLVIFYNNCGTIHILDINYIQYKLIYIFFPFLTSSTQHWLMCYHSNYINSLI
jgi:hypothetical protein